MAINNRDNKNTNKIILFIDKIILSFRCHYNKQFVWKLVTIIFVTILLLQGLYQSFEFISLIDNDNTTLQTFYSTLVGAVAGGIFSFTGSAYVNKKQLKYEQQLKLSEEVYKPLYNELIDNHNRLLENGVFTSLIYIHQNFDLDFGVNYNVWHSIKNDSRSLFLSDSFKTNFDKHIHLIKDILIFKKEFEHEIGRLIQVKYGEHCNEDFKSNARNYSQYVADSILNGNMEEFKKSSNINRIIFASNDNITENITILEELYIKAKESVQYKELVEAGENLLREEEKLLLYLKQHIELSYV